MVVPAVALGHRGVTLLGDIPVVLHTDRAPGSQILLSFFSASPHAGPAWRSKRALDGAWTFWGVLKQSGHGKSSVGMQRVLIFKFYWCFHCCPPAAVGVVGDGALVWMVTKSPGHPARPTEGPSSSITPFLIPFVLWMETHEKHRCSLIRVQCATRSHLLSARSLKNLPPPQSPRAGGEGRSRSRISRGWRMVWRDEETPGRDSGLPSSHRSPCKSVLAVQEGFSVCIPITNVF